MIRIQCLSVSPKRNARTTTGTRGRTKKDEEEERKTKRVVLKETEVRKIEMIQYFLNNLRKALKQKQTSDK